MDGPDLYALLGVDRGADQATVKRAYRRRWEQHPDRLPKDGDPADYKRALEYWKDLTNAYTTLSDADKRAAYDAARAGVRPRSRPPPPPPRARGQDHHGTLVVSFLEALHGATVDYGTGRVTVKRGTPSGTVLRLAGRGGAGFPPGDLLLTVVVTPHPFLRLDEDGLTLLMDLPMTWWEAYRAPLGPIPVPTPWDHEDGGRPFLWRYQEGELVDGQEVVFEGYGVRAHPHDRRNHLKATVRLIAPSRGDLALQQVLQRLQENAPVRTLLRLSLGPQHREET